MPRRARTTATGTYLDALEVRARHALHNPYYPDYDREVAYRDVLDLVALARTLREPTRRALERVERAEREAKAATEARDRAEEALQTVLGQLKMIFCTCDMEHIETKYSSLVGFYERNRDRVTRYYAEPGNAEQASPEHLAALTGEETIS